MFANPSRSCINYISPVISAFVIVEIYLVTPLACSRLRESSEIVESPKLRKREQENGRKLGRGRAAPTPPPFSFFPVLRSYFRVSFTYASFLLSERLEYAWINCARKMAYSACRQYSQKSPILLKIPARTPLFYSNSAWYPKTFSDLQAVYIFANIKRSLGLIPKN